MSVADAGRGADVVGLCVRDDAQVSECADALIPVMPAGSVLLIHSTVRPATVHAVAERAAARGIAVLDAPVSRTEQNTTGPFVFTMTGGDAASAARVKPVLDAYSTDTLHVGPLGSAMALKISNNLVTWVEILIGREAVRLAETAGVPTESLLAVMKRNGALTPAMNAVIQGRARSKDAAHRTHWESQSGIGEKDLALAEALGRDVGVPTPTAAHTRALIRGVMTDFSGR